MNESQKSAHFETLQHILLVTTYLTRMSQELSNRSLIHDQSKLTSPEMEIFAEYTPKLKELTYGSEEYFSCLAEIKPCIDNHYKMNRHHPEHFENGIDGMNLIDLIEMLCDWKAATSRTKDGNILDSLQKNKVRFNISEQLYSIIKNTIEDFLGFK